MSTNQTNKTMALLVAALALGAACSKERPAEGTGEGRASGDLPLPRKLPPAPPPQSGSSQSPPRPTHGAEIDHSYATVRAMYNAAEGATPCESAYNAIAAEQEAAKTMKRDSIFRFVATKDVFLKLCQALPAASQACLVPRYQARNREACATATAPTDQLAKLYVIRPNLDQTAEPDETSPP